MDDQPIEDAPMPLRHSRNLVTAAFLLLVTALWLPWWRLRQVTPGVSDDVFAVRAFSPVDGFTTAWPHATGVLVAALCLWMFVRIAGRSIIYEPETWRKEILFWIPATAVAMASVMFWPIPEFDLLGQRVITGGGIRIEQDWRPALGFWLAGLAMALLVVAWKIIPAVYHTDQPE